MTREEIIKLYDNAILECKDFDRKGKTMPYTSANGHMFSQVNKEGELGIRFDEARQKQYLEEFETTFFKSYGSFMRGYIVIPERVINDMTQLVQLLNEAYRYVMTLEKK